MSVTYLYGHNKLVYNEAADTLPKAGAAKSTVHKTVRPRGPMDDGPTARRQKRTRTRGIKRQARVQVSDSDSGSDKPMAIKGGGRCVMRRWTFRIPSQTSARQCAKAQCRGTVYVSDP